MKKTLVLVDGSSFLYRAFHAMPNLSAPDGHPTGATYGIINMLKQLLKKYNTPYFACIFDTPTKNHRNILYPEYKANRQKTPEDLVLQLDNVYNIIQALGIPLILQNGVEADDVIGTLAIKAQKADFNVIIATGDKDFAQLVNESITLVNTMNNEVLDPEGVLQKFGVAPEQIIDYLSLIGDTADNVPGVSKCGPKTAQKWLTNYGTLDNLIEHKDELTGLVGDNFRNSVTWLGTAKELITIQTDIKTEAIQNLQISKSDYKLLGEYYTLLGFKTWFKQLSLDNNNGDDLLTTSQNNNNSNNDDDHHNKSDSLIYDQLKQNVTQSEQVIVIDQKTELEKLVTRLLAKQNIAEQKIIAISYDESCLIINDQQQTFVIELTAHDNNDLLASVDNQLAPEITRLFLSELPKVTLNYKKILHNEIAINNVIGDITLIHYIYNSRDNQNLCSIFNKFFDLKLIDIPENNLNNLIAMVKHALILEQHIFKKLSKEEIHIYQHIELPIAKVLTKMENAGIMIDTNKFKLIEQEITTQLHVLETQIYTLTQDKFNIASPKQLQVILFEKLNLPTDGLKKNKQGFSTDEETLKILEHKGFTIATLLLEYRMLNKLLNTYVSKLPKLVDSQSRIHTTFDQNSVISGRLASKEPNLQNIPVRNKYGREIRQCFIASPNHVLICADYSQIELRVLAHLSKDPDLINAFNHNLDIHSITASEIFHKPLELVTRDERHFAKTINFSLLYGKTIYGLASELNVDRETAKLYIERYFAKYPSIKNFLEQIKEFAHQNGYVQTIYGRKIYLPNINSQNRVICNAEERLALNAPMQGSCADIIKIAMCNIDNFLILHKLQSTLVLQIHDELIFQVPIEELAIIRDNLAKLMVAGINLAVNLTVEIKSAHNWDEAH